MFVVLDVIDQICLSYFTECSVSAPPVLMPRGFLRVKIWNLVDAPFLTIRFGGVERGNVPWRR